MLKRYIFSPILFLLIVCFITNVNSQVTDDPNAFQVIPNAYSGTAGTATFLGPLANAPRTYQFLINANQLTSMIGTHIHQLSLRIPTSSTADWPTTDVTFTNFDIYLAQSVPPSERSLTFDANIVGAKTQVRAGSLLITAGSYRFGTNPNAFGAPISFNTSYLYTGGHLLVEIRHPGFTGTSRSCDAIGTGISGYGTDFSACWTGNYTGVTGAQGNFCVLQLTNSPIPVGITPLAGTATEFRLLQNYPNPFNPVTKIMYSIPFDSRVVLSVYDMLGREVANLVNNNLQKSGFYSVDFNGANMTSGTYYYKITAQGKEEDFVMTKKMILIK